MTPRVIVDSLRTDGLRELCAELDAEPLLHLSLQSKELFHSNWLAWLCERHEDVAVAVFSTWVPPRDQSARRVQRERSQLDLAVELPGLAPFVIENKVFSPPDDEQLDRYAAGTLAGLDRPELLLLSLGAPTWAPGVHETPSGLRWRYISYLDLADALAGAPLDGFDDFECQLVEHYVHFIRLLHRLAEQTGVVHPDEPIELQGEARDLLRAVRLYDAVGKLRARAAMLELQRSTAQLAGVQNVRWEAGFTNGSPLLQAFVPTADGDEIGWQYQHDQWRLAVICGRDVGRTDELRRAREQHVARSYGAWFDFEALSRLPGRERAPVPKKEIAGGFNRYDPDFVYRYRKLPALTLGELIELSGRYLEAAVEVAG